MLPCCFHFPGLAKLADTARTSLLAISVALAIACGPNLAGGDSVPDIAASNQTAANPVFPLTTEQMLDESTLNLKVLSDQPYISALPSGAKRQLRKVRVRYFSHQWKDGPWEGTVELLIPADIPPGRRGVVFFAPSGSSNPAEGVDVRRDLMERTAVDMGIITASIPDAGRHMGIDNIHGVADAFMIRAIESGDLGWLPGYPFAALRARAVTMIGKLTGVPVHTVIHMGYSISANHAWAWPLHDKRVKGIIATGDIGAIEDWFPLDGSMKNNPRPAFNAMSQAPKEFQQKALRLHDPFYHGAQLHNVLLIPGSNDPYAAPLATARFFAALAQPKHLSIVPNYGHECASRRHVDLARMWLEHLLDNRPITQVAFVAPPVFAEGKLHIRARVQNQAQVKHVQFVYATSAEPNFLRGVLMPDAPKRDRGYTAAKWQTASMFHSRASGGSDEWTTSVEFPAGQTGKLFIAGFVDVEDSHKGLAGYVSTPVQWIEVR